MVPTPNRRRSKIIIKELSLSEVPPVRDQYSRPYVLDYDHHSVRCISESLAEEPDHISASLFATPETNIFVPSDDRAEVADITNGWDCKRFRFIAIIGVENSLARQGDLDIIIQGYTDEMGVTRDGNSLNPSMVFTVNSMIHVSYGVDINPRTGQRETRPLIIDNSHLLCEPGGTIFNDSKHLIRPVDVCSYGKNQMLYDVEGDDGFDAPIVDPSSVVLGSPSKSDRSNAASSQYAAKLFSGMVKDMTKNGFNEAARFGNMKQMPDIAEKSSSYDPFLVAIQHVTNRAISNSFTYRELLKLDTTIDDRVKVGFYSDAAKRQRRDYKETSTWGGQDRNTILATTIGHSLCSVMSQLGIRYCRLFATNNTPGGRISVTIHDARPIIEGGGDTRAFALLRARFEDEVISIVSWQSTRNRRGCHLRHVRYHRYRHDD